LHKHAIVHGSPDAASSLVRHFQEVHPNDPRAAQWVVAHTPLDDPYAVAMLLDSLLEAEAQEQIATLLARDPAAHTPLDDPESVAILLDSLLEAGAQEQVATLLARDPATHTPLDDPHGAAMLLDKLQKAGAEEQVATLVTRLPAAGHFDQFIEVGNNRERFRLGREPDGGPHLRGHGTTWNDPTRGPDQAVSSQDLEWWIMVG
jgi:hypothetical protein